MIEGLQTSKFLRVNRRLSSQEVKDRGICRLLIIVARLAGVPTEPLRDRPSNSVLLRVQRSVRLPKCRDYRRSGSSAGWPPDRPVAPVTQRSSLRWSDEACRASLPGMPELPYSVGREAHASGKLRWQLG